MSTMNNNDIDIVNFILSINDLMVYGMICKVNNNRLILG